MRLYRINLSPPEFITTINQRLTDGRAVRVPVKLRSVELEIMDACYMALSKQTQHLGEYLQCLKNLTAIQNIADHVLFINFSRTDLENLIQGFELTRGNRSDSWCRCLSFFQQLDAPVEFEQPEVSQIEKGTAQSPS
jgi:hypothetical protein